MGLTAFLIYSSYLLRILRRTPSPSKASVAVWGSTSYLDLYFWSLLLIFLTVGRASSYFIRLSVSDWNLDYNWWLGLGVSVVDLLLCDTLTKITITRRTSS